MAKEQKKVERVSATLATGTKVTGSKELIEKLKTRAVSTAKSSSK